MKAQMQKGFTLIELMIVVAIIGILAAIAIPQYQTYVAKSQVQRVVAESGAIKTAVEACILDGKETIGDGAGECDPQATGSSLLDGDAQTSVTLPNGTGVPQVSALTGTDDTITATFGNSAAIALRDETITWTRANDGTWTCQASAGLDDKYLPANCPK
ncbi:prepilin-type cleavage/methylation domain-containing protein [Stutzerimonas nosocomialis]|uniref:Pilin n=1 Tax=Stutzerimonas nosocomialis TaxID=1056496 RepID=A0A5R9QJC2_9GAMM|nr:pilin [Stutzerimonas nosocomialis]TLX60326.1 prepilin-type cleavage/methylation domain-containing protein [Stutzerimonas nosocomialis]TLX65359.1 prepilin-type cleavage/methylation domain-containing protein [Stutzerimonas nosocomialis]